MAVGMLIETMGMSQPLVSKRLKTLRQADLVVANRNDKSVTYTLTDEHVSHAVADALGHAYPPPDPEPLTDKQREGIIMTDTHTLAEHNAADHTHGEGCGHQAIRHGDHVDYLHDGHRHAQHGDHYDEHDAPAEHSPSEHEHGEGCGHEAVEHGDHVDYLHGGHRHATHGDHYDEH